MILNKLTSHHHQLCRHLISKVYSQICIPVNETIDIITSLAFSGVNYYSGFSKKQFVKLLQLCTQDKYFFFNNKVYRQTESVAMGISWVRYLLIYFSDI